MSDSPPQGAASAPAPAHITRPKSPPLAFEKTSNDALVPPTANAFNTSASSNHSLESPSTAMGRRSPMTPATEHEVHLQLLVDQQASAIQLLHDAFAAERQAWGLERERLFQRIASLEHLLKNGNHYSPAKSPLMSPSLSGDLMSPSSRGIIASHTLPTITEDENTRPLSARRESAPKSIQLPGQEYRRSGAVTFTDPNGFKVEEILLTPGRSSNLSPPPPNNRMMAGHTPSRVPRPPTPPPQKMSMDGIEDTPTRNNTHINTLLTQSNDTEEDPELKGPLNMPELPHKPDATNFTLEMLSKKLEQIEKHPEHGKPLVFAQPSPGLASPASEKANDDISPSSRAKLLKDTEAPYAPLATEMPQSVASSTARSPPSALSPQEVHEARVQTEFEQGGIKLKKKASVNFGAPFGTLAGFGPPRKLSQDKS